MRFAAVDQHHLCQLFASLAASPHKRLGREGDLSCACVLHHHPPASHSDWSGGFQSTARVSYLCYQRAARPQQTPPVSGQLLPEGHSQALGVFNSPVSNCLCFCMHSSPTFHSNGCPQLLLSPNCLSPLSPSLTTPCSTTHHHPSTTCTTPTNTSGPLYPV